MKNKSLLLFLIFASCSAEPTKVDVERVIKHFIQLRIQNEITGSKQSDMELFYISCRNNRVNCDKVLEILKKENPEFYQTLTQNQ
ncbi:MAG: hypothetical protein NZ853_04870 [Leptospiraceae bacterium]|nr:hypothetical protein [Leptospiraceae bacterium]MDW7976721.1 hypothetical protein [Leptospiraceae bacterium]